MFCSSSSLESVRELFHPSCRPPPLRCRPDAATTDWVLLDPQAYVADRTNATTAEAISSTGYTIQATFCAADPPDVSYVCIHCPGIEEADFAERPRIICSDKELLLLWVTFKFGPCDNVGIREYFVYKAGPGRPSLHLLPNPLLFIARAWEVGLVPHGDDGHFLLAALCFTQNPWVYDLHLFSSRTWVWSTKVASADMSQSDKVNSQTQPVVHKVISLGGGTLGWVDLGSGIWLCNVLDEVPVVQVIQLPMLMPNNKGKLRLCPWSTRDIACSNGLIKLVEVETHKRQAHETAYYNMEIVYDSDILTKREGDNVGWKIITWYRMSSWNYWHKEHMYYDEDISIDYSRYQISDGGGELVLRNLYASFPVLSLNCHCDDTVYLLCTLKSDVRKIWLITVDLKMKQVIALAPFYIGGYFSPAYPCQLLKYLEGAQASAGSRS